MASHMKLFHMKSNEILSAEEALRAEQILRADPLDILFEGRNKAYGAYELRRAYGRRLRKAMEVVGCIVVALFVWGFVAGRGAKRVDTPMIVRDDTLSVQPPPKVEMRAFTPPRIVKDDVPDDVKPPEQKDLNDMKIGTTNMAGTKDDGLTPPPLDQSSGKGLVEAPKKDEEDRTFIPIEKESEYPGGMEAWKRYLGKNLRSPDGVSNGIQGTVVVKFQVVEGAPVGCSPMTEMV
jgi:periplasmic protein TonB